MKKFDFTNLNLITNTIFDTLSTEIVDNPTIGVMMCGRFALYSNPSQIAKIFNINKTFDFDISYNIAPSLYIPVVIKLPDNKNTLVEMRWGLIPSWQNEENISTSMCNARVETITTKPAYQKAILQRRCLIIADGFYEWKDDTTKQPFFIRMKDHQPFGMAGIWERWIGKEKTIESCSIITLDANELIAPIHNRMPAIIHREHYDSWLNTNTKKWDEIKNLLQPYEVNLMEAYPVSTKVNSARYDISDCIKPI